MKKDITPGVALLLCIALLATITTMGIHHLAQTGSAAVVRTLQGASGEGITIRRLTLPTPKIDLTGLAISWPSLDADLAMERGSEWLAGNTIRVQTSSLTISLAALFPGRFLVKANGISAVVGNQPSLPGHLPADGIMNVHNGLMSLPVSLELWPLAGIRPQIQAQLRALQDLLRSGCTRVPISFWGTTDFRINNETVTAELAVQEQNSSYRLTMNQESLQAISSIMAEKLTAPEMALLAANPIKAPHLLQIRNEARESARRAHEKDSNIPEDAYRHVLWSYLLTKSYNPSFAKQVTDAHEQGITDNSAAEHQMDYANNAVGRKYAAQQVRQDQLIDRLLQDSEVIRQADTHAPY